MILKNLGYLYQDYCLRMNSLPQKISITEALNQACQNIVRTDARMLLQKILGVNHAYLITHPEQQLTLDQTQKFHSLITQRIRGEPVAYLTGEREFYSLNFQITSAVLIPRPETELLVELALERISMSQSCEVLDLGTGSGVVAISIAKNRPLAKVTAVDCSAEALAIAKINIKHLDVNNVCAIIGDWFNGLSLNNKFNLIACNPPYIANEDPHLNYGDLRFEPRLALVGGEDGFDCIRSIINTATRYLVIGGWLLLEHGHDQAETCKQLLIEKGFINVLSYPDLAGILRVSGGIYEGEF